MNDSADLVAIIIIVLAIPVIFFLMMKPRSRK